MTKIKRAGRVLLAAAIVLLAGIYSPFLMTLGWHMFHGGRVHYRGLNVVVPWPWVADTQDLDDDSAASPQGLLLTRSPMSLLGHNRGTATIDVNILLTDPGTDPQREAEQWQDLFRGSHAASTFSLESADPQVPGEPSCAVARSRLFPSRVEWTCISVKNGWAASFDGSEKDADTFLKVVRKLKP